MPTTGRALRSERRQAEVTTVALAARMGIARGTLWIIERSAVVDPDRATQYRQALNALRDASETSGNAA